MCSPSAPSESSGQQSVPTELLCDASCSGALSSTSARAPAEVSSEGAAVASTPLERSQPEGTEDTSGGCRRAEPTVAEEGEEGQSQPARGNQDSDDSDDDPILIPSTRFRGQGQRYAGRHVLGCSLSSRRFRHCSFLILHIILPLTVSLQI